MYRGFGSWSSTVSTGSCDPDDGVPPWGHRRQSGRPEEGVVNLGGTEFLISPNGTASGYRAQMACQMEILAGEILMHEQDFHGLRTVHDGKETKVHTSTLLSAEPWRSRSASPPPSANKPTRYPLFYGIDGRVRKPARHFRRGGAHDPCGGGPVVLRWEGSPMSLRHPASRRRGLSSPNQTFGNVMNNIAAKSY
jgi:hypothetical protein